MEAKPSRMASSEAYSWNSFSAEKKKSSAPRRGRRGMLSLESPMIACTSGHCVGLRPVSSSKLLRVTIFFVPAGRVPHHDVVMQALLEVLVGSHEDHRAFLAVTLGKRGEAVVRLAAVGDFEVQAERLDEPMDGIDLLDEVFRGGAALRLVQREKLVPEVGAVPVEHEANAWAVPRGGCA